MATLHESKYSTITLDNGLLVHKWSGETDSAEVWQSEMLNLLHIVKTNDVSKVLIDGENFSFHVPHNLRTWAYENIEGSLIEMGIGKIGWIYPKDKAHGTFKQYFTNSEDAHAWMN